MAILPGAIYKPITASKGRKALTLYNRVNLHVAVSEASSLYGYFNKSGIADSHFYVRKDGTIEQYVDTALRAFADVDGNDATISVETQGGVHSAQSEPWTPAQVASLARIYAWAVETHGIAAKIATDSKLGASSQGLSWHRLGIDGNFPSGRLGGRRQHGGGMRYSSSAGKICPGDAKIGQVDEIFALATNGAAPVASPAAPAPAPKPAPAPAGPRRAADGNLWLAEDGKLGPATIARWQQILGTSIDGVISTGRGGSSLVRAVQRRLVNAGFSVGRAGVDGHGIFPNIGKSSPRTDTIAALQRYLGTSVDGVLSAPSSSAVVALQKRLNACKF